MLSQVSKWINANTLYPVGNICVNATVEDSNYSNMIEFIRYATSKINAGFIVVKPSELPAPYKTSIPSNTLCFNTENSKVIEESISFVKKGKVALNYEYIVLFDSSQESTKINFDVFLTFAVSLKSKIVILMAIIFLVLFYSKGSNSFYGFILFFQLLCLYLIGELEETRPSNFIKNVCSLGEQKGDNCFKLKKSTEKIFGYFDFSDLGIIYFSSLIGYGCIFLVFPESVELNHILYFSFIFGALFATYSIYLQFRSKIFCPICLFVVLICFGQLLYLSYFNLGSNNFLMEVFLLLFLLPLIFLGFIVNTKAKNFFKEKYFFEKTILKKMFRNNVNEIKKNFISNKSYLSILNTYSLSFNKARDDHEVIVCVGLDCGSCIRWLNDLRQCDNAKKLNIKLLFNVSPVKGSMLNSPLLEGNILLGYLLRFYGFDTFMTALNLFVNSGYNTTNLKKYTRLNFEVPLSKDYTLIKEIIIEQNIRMDDLEIHHFPFILYQGKVIPSYISPFLLRLMSYDSNPRNLDDGLNLIDNKREKAL